MNMKKLSLAVLALAAATNVAAAKQSAPPHVCVLPTFQEQVRAAQNWRQIDARSGSPEADEADARCQGEMPPH